MKAEEFRELQCHELLGVPPMKWAVLVEAKQPFFSTSSWQPKLGSEDIFPFMCKNCVLRMYVYWL